MSFDTVCLSIYSLISILIMSSSLPNISFAKALTTSVFPTPVGPTNIKDAGFLLFLKPERFLLTVLEMLDIASSWPITLW